MKIFNFFFVVILTAPLFSANASAESEDEIFKVIWNAYQDGFLEIASAQIFEYLEKFPDGRFADRSLALRVDIFYQQGKFNEAQKWLKILLEKYPDSDSAVRAAYKWGVMYFEREEYKTAAEYLKLTLDHDLSKAETQTVSFWLAESFYRLSFFSEAAAYYRVAARLNVDKDLADYAEYSLGLSLFEQGRYGESIHVFKSVLHKDNDPRRIARAKNLLGKALFHTGAYDEALKYLEESPISEENDHTDPQTMELLAKTCFYLERYDEAVKHLERLFEYNNSQEIPHSLQYIYCIALLNMEPPAPLSKIESALMNYLNDRHDDSIAGRLLFQLGLRWMRANTLKATRYFILSLDYAESSERLRRQITQNLHELKRDHLARYFRTEIPDIDSFDSIKEYLSVANEKQENGYFDEALAMYEKLGASLPEDHQLKPDVALRIAGLKLETGDYMDAHRSLSPLLNQLSKQDEQYREKIIFLLAESLFGLKDYPAAAALYEELLSEKETENSSLIPEIKYGLVLSRLGDYAKASEIWEKVLNRSPPSDYLGEIYFESAVAHHELGEYDKAFNKYRKAKELAGDEEMERRVSAALKSLRMISPERGAPIK